MFIQLVLISVIQLALLVNNMNKLELITVGWPKSYNTVGIWPYDHGRKPYNIIKKLIYYHRRFDITKWSDYYYRLHKYQNYIDYYAVFGIPKRILLRNYHVWRLIEPSNNLQICPECLSTTEVYYGEPMSRNYDLSCEYCERITRKLFKVTNIRQLRPKTMPD